jgi:hypothetical protein
VRDRPDWIKAVAVWMPLMKLLQAFLRSKPGQWRPSFSWMMLKVAGLIRSLLAAAKMRQSISPAPTASTIGRAASAARSDTFWSRQAKRLSFTPK